MGPDSSLLGPRVGNLPVLITAGQCRGTSGYWICPLTPASLQSIASIIQRRGRRLRAALSLTLNLVSEWQKGYLLYSGLWLTSQSLQNNDSSDFIESVSVYVAMLNTGRLSPFSAQPLGRNLIAFQHLGQCLASLAFPCLLND